MPFESSISPDQLYNAKLPTAQDRITRCLDFYGCVYGEYQLPKWHPDEQLFRRRSAQQAWKTSLMLASSQSLVNPLTLSGVGHSLESEGLADLKGMPASCLSYFGLASWLDKVCFSVVLLIPRVGMKRKNWESLKPQWLWKLAGLSRRSLDLELGITFLAFPEVRLQFSDSRRTYSTYDWESW